MAIWEGSVYTFVFSSHQTKSKVVLWTEGKFNSIIIKLKTFRKKNIFFPPGGKSWYLNFSFSFNVGSIQSSKSECHHLILAKLPGHEDGRCMEQSGCLWVTGCSFNSTNVSSVLSWLVLSNWSCSGCEEGWARHWPGGQEAEFTQKCLSCKCMVFPEAHGRYCERSWGRDRVFEWGLGDSGWKQKLLF